MVLIIIIIDYYALTQNNRVDITAFWQASQLPTVSSQCCQWHKVSMTYFGKFMFVRLWTCLKHAYFALMQLLISRQKEARGKRVNFARMRRVCSEWENLPSFFSINCTQLYIKVVCIYRKKLSWHRPDTLHCRSVNISQSHLFFHFTVTPVRCTESRV